MKPITFLRSHQGQRFEKKVSEGDTQMYADLEQHPAKPISRRQNRELERGKMIQRKATLLYTAFERSLTLNEEIAAKALKTPRMSSEPVKLEKPINTPATYAYDLR